MTDDSRFDVAVAGAGPAGMMAALSAAGTGASVVLLEKNPSPGRKLLLTGKGRCNLTNDCGLSSFLERFGKNGPFLRDAFKALFNRGLVDYFETRGLMMKTERQARVFPVTDKAGSVLEVLMGDLEKRGVRLLKGAAVSAVQIKEGRVRGLKLKDRGTLACDKLIVATGGLSYPGTGSDGDGLRWAAAMGHRITDPGPALAPLRSDPKITAPLEGLTLKNIRLEFSSGSRRLVSDIGEVLFTRTGISGPLVLTHSGRIGEWLADEAAVSAGVDLKPALSEEQLERRILREFGRAPNKQAVNVLKALLPARLIPVFLNRISLGPEVRAHSVPRAARRKMVALLKDFRMPVTGTAGFSQAMVTRGGVSLKDINPRTLESRKVRGLYFAGEIIDVDGDTGGFNLQAAFSTGYLAGLSAAGRRPETA